MEKNERTNQIGSARFKRVLSLLLAVLLAVSTVPTQALATGDPPDPAGHTVTFTVKDSRDDPVEGASIEIDGDTLTTDSSGQASTELEAGTYSYTATAVDCYEKEGSVTVEDGDVNETVNLVTKVTLTVNVSAIADDADGFTVTVGDRSSTDEVSTFDLPYNETKTVKIESGKYEDFTVTVKLTEDKELIISDDDLEVKRFNVEAGSFDPNQGTVDIDKTTVKYGEDAEVTVTPAEGYTALPEVNGSKQGGNEFTISNIKENQTIDPNFQLIEYTLTAELVNGSLTVSGDQAKNAGNITYGKHSFTIKAEDEFHIVGVSVNGVEQNPFPAESNDNTSYTTGEFDVASDTTISATFKKNTYTVTIDVPDQLTVTRDGEKLASTDGKIQLEEVESGTELDLSVSAVEPKIYRPEEDHISLTVSGDQTITLKADVIEYSVKLYDGLEAVPEEYKEQSYTGLEASIVLPKLSKDGYKFLGWYQANTEDNTVDATCSDIKVITKDDVTDYELYAVWSIEGTLSVEGKGTLADGKTEVQSDADNSANTWFGSNVTLTLTLDNDYNVDPDAYQYKVGDAASETETSEIAVPAKDFEATQTVYTITGATQTKEADGVTYTYSTEFAPVSFTVKQDLKKPAVTLERRNPEGGTWDEWDDVTLVPEINTAANEEIEYQLSASDADSGLKTQEYLNVSYEDARNCESEAALASWLLGLDGWADASAGTFTANDDGEHVLIVRVIDNVGNVRFVDSDGILFDSNAPAVSVVYEYSYLDENGELAAVEPDVPPTYTDRVDSAGEITAVITIKDDYLVFSHEDEYTSKIFINDSEEGTEVTFKKNDDGLWVAAVTISEPGKNTLTVPVFYDAAGNGGFIYSAKDFVGMLTDEEGNGIKTFTNDQLIVDTLPPVAYLNAGNYYITDGDGNAVTLGADESMIYEDSANQIKWIKQGEPLELVVVDEDGNGGFDGSSGLADVAISLNGSEYNKSEYSAQIDERSYAPSFEIGYDDLQPGVNTIVIMATDNVGNRLVEKRFTIYKDDKTPVIESVNIAGVTSIREYGTYTNGEADIAIKVVIDDISDSEGVKFTSGLKTTTLTFENGNSYQAELQDTLTAEAPALTESAETVELTFVIKAKAKDVMNTEGFFSFYLEDNVGNGGIYDKLEQFGSCELKVNHLMVENVEPDVTDVKLSPNAVTVNDIRWFGNENVTFIYDVSDSGKTPYSGVSYAEIKINDVKLTTHDFVVDQKDGAPTAGGSNRFNLRNGNWKVGENKVVIALYDDAGNSAIRTEYVYVDKNDPIVTGYAFRSANHNGADDGASVVATDYGYFFSKETKVTVHVEDEGPSSGIATIMFATVPVNGGEVTYYSASVNSDCDVQDTVTADAVFTVPAGFKGQIYAWVGDHTGHYQTDGDQTFAGRDGKWRHPDGTIVETQQQHDRYQHISIEALTTPVTYLDGGNNPLYNDNAQVKLTVSDAVAGIQSIEYTVESAHDTGKNQSGSVNITYGRKDHSDGTGESLHRSVSQTNSDGNSWTVTKEDLNLATEMTKTLTISNNSNDIKVKVKMTDNCGNTSEQEFILSIDKDAPEVTVTFQPAEEGDDPTWTGYFKDDRTMTVTVKERNFDPSKVSFHATRDGAPLNIGASFGNGTESVENGIQYFTYTMTYTFSAEDSDFTFGVSVIDKANNETTDDEVNYGSAAAKEVAKQFTIDHVVPVIDVTYSGDAGTAGYYKSTVVATVTITERNFDPSRLECIVTGIDTVTGETLAVIPGFIGWSENGNQHTGTVTFEMEGRYQITSITFVDKAGNEAVAYTGETFIVDLSRPEISFFTDSTAQTNLDHYASNGSVTPYIVVSDTNYDHIEYSLTRYRANGDVVSQFTHVYTSPAENQSGTTGTVLFDNFPVEEDIDDIYVLHVTAVDKAGWDQPGSAMFSVNRFGSTYMLDTSTKELTDTYYVNQEQAVTIVEINATPLTDQQVTVSRNGGTTVLTEGTDYTVEANVPIIGADSTAQWNTDSHWFEYTYTVNKSNFEQEGRYLVDILTTDEVENMQTNETSKHDENLFVDDLATLAVGENANAPVEFIVDKTKPVLALSEIDHQNYGNSIDVVISCQDETALDRVEVQVNGDTQTLEASLFASGTYTYTVNESRDMQVLSVTAYDKAGNANPIQSDEFQVTMNLWALFTHNILAMIIAAVLVTAVAIILILVIKRRKDSKTAATV